MRTCTARPASSPAWCRRPRGCSTPGCGFGRVASKLTRLGHTAIGVDADEHLIALAREDPQTRFFVADLSTLDLRTEQEFACVVMAGNVVPYLADGTLPRVLDRLAAHLAPGGYLVAGLRARGLAARRRRRRSTCGSTTGWRRPPGCRSSRGTRRGTSSRSWPGAPTRVSVHRRLGA